MKNLIVSVFLLAFGLAGIIPEAEARRFGSGSSFGMQRQATPPASTPRQPAAAPSTARPSQPAATSTSGRSWLGPVAGLAAGLGLAALFSHLGLGEEFGSIILLALLAFVAFALFRRLTRTARPAPGSPMAFATQGAGTVHAPTDRSSGTADTKEHAPTPQAFAPTATVQGFDSDAFARQAKVQFIRLQAAHDARDLEDIRQFTTPEVFAEVRMQLAEAGSEPTHTDVVDLSAQVIEVSEEAGHYIVSVRFHGLIREQAGSEPAAFDEVWHLTKPRDCERGWVIAGIQQLN